MPDSGRFLQAQRIWGAVVHAEGADGNMEEHFCLLQVAVSSKDRSMECVTAAVDDARDAGSYAHRFNQYVANTCGEGDPDSVPHIKVCASVACYVLGSALPDGPEVCLRRERGL